MIWQKDKETAVCASNQEIAHLLMPNCTDGQVVIFRAGEREQAGSLVCEDPTIATRILARGDSVENNGAPQIDWDFTIDAPGLLYLTADVKSGSATQALKTAAVVSVDGVECNRSSAFVPGPSEWTDADAFCVLHLLPGDHKIQVAHYLMGADAVRLSHIVHWYVVRTMDRKKPYVVAPSYPQGIAVPQ